MQPPPAAAIVLVSGSGVADTVRATPAQPLVVEVHGADGKPAPNVILYLEAVAFPQGHPTAGAYAGLVVPTGEAQFVIDTTDASGRVSQPVRLGTVAGPAQVVIRAPSLDLVDTAKFTVRPGKPRTILIGRRDLTVITGGSYLIGATALDQYSNQVTEPLTYTTKSSAVSVDVAGFVRTLAPGRAGIAVRAGDLADSARVSVVPDLTILTKTTTGDDGLTDRFRPGTIWTMRLDGSQKTALATVLSGEAYPRQNPKAAIVAFFERDAQGAGTNHLHITDLSNHRSQVPMTSLPDAVTQLYPRWSADGQWIYFTGQSASTGNLAVWRIHPDGTGGERLASSTTVSYSQGSPSPDGTHVALTVSGLTAADLPSIAVLTVATGEITSLGVKGRGPEYSPDGTRIAYTPLGSPGAPVVLGIINADGTNQRTVAGVPPGSGFDIIPSVPSWSPDGKWIINGGGSYRFRTGLVNVATLELIPVNALDGHEQPSFRY